MDVQTKTIVAAKIKLTFRFHATQYQNGNYASFHIRFVFHLDTNTVAH